MMTAVRRALVALLIIAVALIAALSGCAGGAVCFRNSDCQSGYGCRQGACELLVTPSTDAGDAAADSASTGTDDASTDDASTSDTSTDDAGDAASQSADAG